MLLMQLGLPIINPKRPHAAIHDWSVSKRATRGVGSCRSGEAWGFVSCCFGVAPPFSASFAAPQLFLATPALFLNRLQKGDVGRLHFPVSNSTLPTKNFGE